MEINEKTVLKALPRRKSKIHKGEFKRMKMREIAEAVGVVDADGTLLPKTSAKVRKVLAALVGAGTVARDGSRSSTTYRRA